MTRSTVPNLLCQRQICFYNKCINAKSQRSASGNIVYPKMEYVFFSCVCSITTRLQLVPGISANQRTQVYWWLLEHDYQCCPLLPIGIGTVKLIQRHTHKQISLSFSPDSAKIWRRFVSYSLLASI